MPNMIQVILKGIPDVVLLRGESLIFISADCGECQNCLDKPQFVAKSRERNPATRTENVS